MAQRKSNGTRPHKPYRPSVEKPSHMARVTAEDLAKKQKEISVAEFFERNKHMLGFDSPTRSLITSVKEALDNSFDACEEAGIQPTIMIQITKRNT